MLFDLVKPRLFKFYNISMTCNNLTKKYKKSNGLLGGHLRVDTILDSVEKVKKYCNLQL